MTTAPGMDLTTNNTAESHAVVGIQGETVRDSNVYFYSDQSPEQKYQVGTRYLADGVPTRARELIGDAIAHHYESGEVRFHWLLAMLSKRSYRELTAGEMAQLRQLPEMLERYADDEWKHGLRAVCGLLDCLEDPKRDSGPVLRELLSLAPEQRGQILKHLDMVLTGPIRERLWAGTRDAALADRFADDRARRVWTYFQPTPAPPLRAYPEPITTTSQDWLTALLATALSGIGLLGLGWSMFHTGPVQAIAYLVFLAAGCVIAWFGAGWWSENQLVKAKERRFTGIPGVNWAPADEFADRVDRLFNHYTHKHVPANTDQQVWLAQIAGRKAMMREEVVGLYRDSGARYDQLWWLVEHMVVDLKARRENGTLLEYRARYRTPDSDKVFVWVGIVVAIPALLVILGASIASPAFLAGAAAAGGGWSAAHRWQRILTEGRRVSEEEQECEQRFTDLQAAYDRVRSELETMRPTEAQMERWLDCDKTALIEEAMQHYRMTWHDVIAHTFLQTPAQHYRRAKITNGPWRYSRYGLRLFLITVDGVREISTELDFESGSFTGQRRRNFRFDAITSVNVQEKNRVHQTLELELTNGPPVKIQVVDQVEEVWDVERTSELTVESAGFAHALHIFEGIAAEGKQWVNRLRRSTTELTDSDLQERRPDDT